MNQSYETLFNAYNRLQAKVQDLEEQLQQKQHQWSERDSEDELTERRVRELCEEILSRRRQTTDKNCSWSGIPLKELIYETKTAFEEYTVSNRETLMKVLNTSEERRVMIESLENQISVMKKNPGSTTITQEELLEQLKKDKAAEEALRKAGHKAMEAAAEGRIKFTMDDDDEFSDLEKDMYQASMGISEQAKIMPKSIPKTESRKRIEEIKKFRKSAEANMYMEELSAYEKELKPIDWESLILIGSTGLSVLKEIVQAMMKKNIEYKDSSIRNSIKGLANMHLLAKETVSTPLRGTITLYRLDEKGVILYRQKTGNNPVKSEMEKVVTEHDSYAHGYGILEVAGMLKEKPYVKSVEYMNRKKPIQLGGGSSVIPDIICTDKNDSTLYIEYECGNHNQTNFSAKCSKLCKLDRYVNIIAPNDTTLKKLMEQVEKWMKSKGHSIDRYTIRLTTSSYIKDVDLRKNSGWKIIYHPEKGIAPAINY